MQCKQVVLQVLAACLFTRFASASSPIIRADHAGTIADDQEPEHEVWQVSPEGSLEEIVRDKGDVMELSSMAQLHGITSKFAGMNVMYNATNLTEAFFTRNVFLNEVIADDDRLKFRVMAFLNISLPLVLVGLCLMGPGFEKTQTETTGAAEPAEKQSEEPSVQTAFESVDASSVEEKTFFETIYKEKGDSVVPALCEDPGIYTLVWATRTVTVDQSLIFMLSVILQIFLPMFLFNAVEYTHHRATELPASATGWAKCIWPAVLVFTISTMKGTVVRVSGMLILRKAVKGWSVILLIGAVTQVISCIVTLIATKSLFYNDPTVRDMLLNACAVNFIPDIDKSLVQLIGTADPRSVRRLAVAKERLAQVAEAWPESKERKEFQAWFKLSLREQLRERPYVFMIALVDFVLCLLCMLSITRMLFEMCDGSLMWLEFKPYSTPP